MKSILLAVFSAVLVPGLLSAQAAPAAPTPASGYNALPPKLGSQDPIAAWLRTRAFSNALNPRISVIPDFTAVAAPRGREGGLRMRELELAFQAEVDPYARTDVYVSFPHGEPVELEEAYVTLLSLPGGLQARGGKFRANFGRLNLVHTHELDQVDRPLVLSRFLGEEGLNTTGAELSRVFSPLGVFSEASYGLLNDLGEGEEAEEATTTVTDVDGNRVTVKVDGNEDSPSRRWRNYAHLGRLRFYGDLNDANNVQVSFSGALHQPAGFEHRRLGAAELTYRWRPQQQGLYRSFLWRTEALFEHRELLNDLHPVTGALRERATDTHRRGIYSYAEAQFSRRWRAGLRGDYAESPEARASREPTRAVSPYLSFALSEYNRFRLQYQYRRAPGGIDESRTMFQWTVVLGPHGAHQF